ncbi:ABC transporter ATP-binding protein [Qaidamihabitans albus]|uniref:ABC transporter ATP-binding protein n=1 Tax=Qaidamihabitans albus TaxID=2795733 RepID=UPI0018F1136F|nr:ABC transporter ATP-binding protein [Qaidamihabitans albus]
MAEPALPAPRLAARGLSRTFSAEAGVHDVDLEIGPGEIHALVGLNGAGKTTLMRLVLGMLRPHSGDTRLDGRDIRAADAQTWTRVGHLVDHPLAYGELDARTNLALAARLHGVPRSRVNDAVERIVADLDLSRYVTIRARNLSQGNRQRLGLAAALLHHPTVIVLDEPTNALDPAGVILLREILLGRARAGAGILVSSHHLDEVARVADRITVVNHGRTIGALDPGGIDIERAFFRLVHADEANQAGGRPG